MPDTAVPSLIPRESERGSSRRTSDVREERDGGGEKKDADMDGCYLR